MTLSTLQINSEMMGAMKGVNDVMGKVNEEMNVQDIQKVIREFSKESEKFGMNQELVSQNNPLNYTIDGGVHGYGI